MKRSYMQILQGSPSRHYSRSSAATCEHVQTQNLYDATGMAYIYLSLISHERTFTTGYELGSSSPEHKRSLCRAYILHRDFELPNCYHTHGQPASLRPYAYRSSLSASAYPSPAGPRLPRARRKSKIAPETHNTDPNLWPLPYPTSSESPSNDACRPHCHHGKEKAQPRAPKYAILSRASVHAHRGRHRP
jgi:hypothetical protein